MIEVLLVAAFIDRWQPVDEMKPPTLPELVTPHAADPLPTPTHASAHHPPREHRDICARYGGHRQDYTKDHHGYWRCVYPHRR